MGSTLRVGYIGLGRMGGPMAHNLVRTGFPTFVHDANPQVAVEGAVWSATPAEVARQADIIFTCLPGPQEVEAVMHGGVGLLEHARPGKIFVECTTTEPAQIRSNARCFADRGSGYIDACVSGGPSNSESGTLVLMLGGDPGDIARARPALEAVGSRLHHFGPVGSGTIAKLVHNLVHNAILQIAIEAIAMGMKAGLTSAALVELLQEGAVGQGALTRWQLPPMTDGRELGPQFFPVRMSAKDVGLAMDVARELGAAMPIASLVEQNFSEALSRGLGDRDNRAIAELLAARSGLPNGLIVSGASDKSR